MNIFVGFAYFFSEKVGRVTGDGAVREFFISISDRRVLKGIRHVPFQIFEYSFIFEASVHHLDLKQSCLEQQELWLEFLINLVKQTEAALAVSRWHLTGGRREMIFKRTARGFSRA